MKRPNDARQGQPTELVPLELVDRCKAGDQRAWRELVDATYREVYTLCLRILRDPDDAAEATQDTFVKVWCNLGGFRAESMFTTWLYRVAANTAISKQRSTKRTRTHEVGGEETMLSRAAASDSTEAAAGARIDLQALDRALAGLPEHYRSAVVLRDVYQLSIEEIAKEMKITETAAKVRVHRGRKMVRELMDPGDRGA